MQEHPLGILFTAISFLAGNLIPIMTVGFCAAFIFRVLVYITVQRQSWFVKELEKRIYRVLSHLTHHEEVSFFSVLKDTMQTPGCGRMFQLADCITFPVSSSTLTIYCLGITKAVESSV